MLDWLTSKFVMTIAALLILSSAFGLIYSQREVLEKFELKKIAEKIADNVNTVGYSLAEIKLVISFEEDPGAISLPRMISDKSYVINISKNSVAVSQDSKLSIRTLMTSVHLWNPNDFCNENKTYLEEIDGKNPFLTLTSGSDFVIESRVMILEDDDEFHTFVYKE